MELSPTTLAVFPKLHQENYRVTSAADGSYNGMAYAADRTDYPWWPVEPGTTGVCWPEAAAVEETVDAFVAAFATLGYVVCAGPELEAGSEKIAIYADSSGVPKHAARQLPTGAWASKLGDLQDIEHKSLADLEGDAYGRAVRFLIRQQNR